MSAANIILTLIHYLLELMSNRRSVSKDCLPTVVGSTQLYLSYQPSKTFTTLCFVVSVDG